MNLKELSELLGISQTTVSRALNGYPEVNEKTRQRVTAAALKHGYKPSAVARRLAGKRAEAVGLVYPFDLYLRSSPEFLEMVQTLSRRLRQENIDLLIVPGAPEEEIDVYKRMLASGRVDAFVVSAVRRQDERIQWLLKNNVPFVAHGRSDVGGFYYHCDADNVAALKDATEHLIKLGHKNIVLINPDDSLAFAWERKQGYLQAMQAHEDIVSAPIIFQSSLDDEEAYSQVVKALALSEELRPTALIVGSMLNARGALLALREQGLDVGEEISVVAWDDGVAGIDMPDMAVISAPIAHSGTRLGELVLEALQGKVDEVSVAPLPAKLIPKGSIGPVRPSA